ARTRAASESYGREQGRPDRLADTQIRLSYRGSEWVRDDAPDLDEAVPQPGDRAPDAGGLRRCNLGFPLRLFDMLRGPQHVLLAYARADELADLAALGQELRARFGESMRVVAVTPADAALDQPGIAILHDRDSAFASAYGAQDASFLVRPDGYIGWRGPHWRVPGLMAHLSRILRPA